jgi:hypothetical protein
LFISDDLGLATLDDPPAQIGIRLESYPNLGVLVDPGDLQPVSGSALSNSFPSYIVATPEGRSPQQVAVDTLRLWCDHVLHLDGYEAELKRILSR